MIGPGLNSVCHLEDKEWKVGKSKSRWRRESVGELLTRAWEKGQKVKDGATPRELVKSERGQALGKNEEGRYLKGRGMQIAPVTRPPKGALFYGSSCVLVSSRCRAKMLGGGGLFFARRGPSRSARVDHICLGFLELLGRKFVFQALTLCLYERVIFGGVSYGSFGDFSRKSLPSLF